MQTIVSSKFEFISLIKKAESLLLNLKINSSCIDHDHNLIDYICLCKKFLCKDCLFIHSKSCSSPKLFSVSFLIERFKNELNELKLNSLLLLKKENFISSKFCGFILNLEKNLNLFVLISLENIVLNNRSINAESISSMSFEKKIINNGYESIKNEYLENFLFTEICGNKINNRQTDKISIGEKHEIKKAEKFNKNFCKLNKLISKLLKNKTKISSLKTDSAFHEIEYLKNWIQLNYAKDNYLTEFFSDGFSFKNILREDFWVALIFVYLKNEIFAKFQKEIYEFNFEKNKENENNHVKNLIKTLEIFSYKKHNETEFLKEVPSIQNRIDGLSNLETNKSFSPIFKKSILTEKADIQNSNISEIFNSEDKEKNKNDLENMTLNLKIDNYSFNPDLTNESTQKINLISPEVETLEKIKETAITFNQEKNNNEEKSKLEKFEEIKNNLKLISQNKKFQSFTSISSRKHSEKDQILSYNNSSSNPSLDTCTNNSENFLVKIETNLGKFENKIKSIAENFESNKNKLDNICENGFYEITNYEIGNKENKIHKITNEIFFKRKNSILSMCSSKNRNADICSRDSTPREVDFFSSSNSLIRENEKKSDNFICQNNLKLNNSKDEFGKNFTDNFSKKSISNKKIELKTQNEDKSFTDDKEESDENDYKNKNLDIFNGSFMKKFEKFKLQYFPLDSSKDFKNSFFIKDKKNTKTKSSKKFYYDNQNNKAKKFNKINSNDLLKNKEEFLNIYSGNTNRITNKNLEEILKNKNEKIDPLNVSINLQTLNSQRNNWNYDNKYFDKVNYFENDKINITYSNESNPQKNSITKYKNFKNDKNNNKKNKNFNFNLNMIQNKNKNYARCISRSSSVSKSKNKNQIVESNKDSLKFKEKKEIITNSKINFQTKKKIDLDTHIVHLVDDSDDLTGNEILLENLVHNAKETCTTINQHVNSRKLQINENSSQYDCNNNYSKISEQKNKFTISTIKENPDRLNESYNKKFEEDKIKSLIENTIILECKQENKENFNPNKILHYQNNIKKKENILDQNITENNYGNKILKNTNSEKQSKKKETGNMYEITDLQTKKGCEEGNLDSSKEEFKKIFNSLVKINNSHNPKSSIDENELLNLAKKALSMLSNIKDSKISCSPSFKNHILEELLKCQSKNLNKVMANSKSGSEYNMLISNFEEKKFNHHKGNMIKDQKDTQNKKKSENEKESQGSESQKLQEILNFGNSLNDNSDKSFSKKKNHDQNNILQNLIQKCNLDLYKKDIEREEDILKCVDCGEYFSMIPGASFWRKRCIKCFNNKIKN